jgi:hypothetical protein
MGTQQGYLTDAMKSDYDNALYTQFDTFKRPFTVWLNAQIAIVNTNPNFAGQFGDQSQNVLTTPVTSQPYVISGVIKYGNQQPWEYIEPGSRGNYHQDKVRESFGKVSIKVDASGYALFSQVKQVELDGLTFQMGSTPRPHGLVGAPTRWTYTLDSDD